VSTLCSFLFDSNSNFVKGNWRTVELSEIFSLPIKKKPTTIDPNKLLTVKLHMKGVHKNENSETLSIGSTIYFIREKGQFIYGKQNLHNGALGIIPVELDGFLSSSDVPALEINIKHANKDFILNLIGQAKFYKKLEDIATGSGSKRIHEATLLKVKVQIPSLEEQGFIAKTINSLNRKMENEGLILIRLKMQKSYLLENLF